MRLRPRWTTWSGLVSLADYLGQDLRSGTTTIRFIPASTWRPCGRRGVRDDIAVDFTPVAVHGGRLSCCRPTRPAGRRRGHLAGGMRASRRQARAGRVTGRSERPG